MTHPYFAYYDQQRKCSSCGLGFTFSKEEQQYWYEELQFITWSDAKDCVECRKAKREPKERNAKISNLVRDLVPENLDQIEELVQLYLEIGNTEKAKYFMSIGRKNVNDKNSDKIKERLERVKERIVAYENSNGQPDRGR